MNRFRVLVALSAALACLAVAAQGASAATFCVNSPTGCSGTLELTITGALSDAAVSPGMDTIEIAGSNTYHESGLTDASGNPVSIVGVGSAPVITTAGPEPVMMAIQDPASTISNVAFQLATGSTGVGLAFAGVSATGITVTGAAGNGADGINLTSPNATLSHASVTLPTSNSVQTIAVFMSGDGEHVGDSSLQASIGAYINSGTGMTISRTEIEAPIGVRASNGAADTIEDSLVLVEGASGGDVTGIQSNSAGGTVTVRGDTIIGLEPTATGVAATQGLPTSSTNAIAVSDSIIRGFETDLYDSGAGAALTTDYDDYTTKGSGSGAAPITAGVHDLDIDPDFVDAVGGDYHLAAASPLIDKGDPAPLAGGESGTDFYGADRLVAGHGGCNFVRDIGAAEFQTTAPTASATGPATAVAGSAVTFNGSKSCGPGSRSPIAAYRWSFGDGSSATGVTVRHAYATAGRYTVTLTVSTAAGHVASTSLVLAVSAKLVTIPRLSKLSLSPHRFATRARHHHKPGATVRYRLNESALVKFVVERRSHGHYVKLRGTFTERGRAGGNHFHFAGVVHGHKLAKGRYMLVATPTSAGRTGKPAGVRFTAI